MIEMLKGEQYEIDEAAGNELVAKGFAEIVDSPGCEL